MPRRKVVAKRPVLPDAKYSDLFITRCVNVLMKEGKKNLAEHIMYGALELVRERTGEDPLKVFRQAVDNVKPVLEVRSRRVGGSTYQIPVDVPPDRRIALSMRWIVGSARSRGERGMMRRLAAELVDAYNNTGTAVKKREDTHRMAEANKAFAHYRW
ncbi:MAG TPA: 30S ribosomal protein S7 [Candidatus Tectomicrobia bacterium]